MSATKHSPTRRAARMAAMSAGVAGSYLGYLMQRAFLDEPARDTKLRATHTRAARRVRNEMQSLKGPAMKLGQLLSMQAGVVPDEAIAELASLQMEAPGMHASLVRATFRGSMRTNPEDVFAEFELEPFAAASLGQVHRAVTRAGERVAVKIQYPGIRDAVAADFTWFRTLSKPVQLSRYFPPDALAELERQIVAETDYEREADSIEFFSEQLRSLSGVAVPRVFREYSSDRVLTMSMMPGQHLARYLASRPSQKVRDALGEKLFELFYYQVLHVGAFHADPHWGNYLFQSDGRIGLVDFGCVKTLTPAFVADLRALYLYPGARDSAHFHELLKKRYALFGAKLAAPARRALAAFSETFYRRVYPPEPEKFGIAFDFGDAAFLRDYMRASSALLRSKGILPEYLFLARAEMGLYHTLHQLRARVHTSRIVSEQLAQ
jgi:predicted unusual protein kinase regulating ubiquinone biosynthesis (AarF/ABC1/UbiB family)